MSLGDSEKRHFFLRISLEKSMDEKGISYKLRQIRLKVHFVRQVRLKQIKYSWE